MVASWVKSGWDDISPEMVQKKLFKPCIAKSMDAFEDDHLWEEETKRDDRDSEYLSPS